MADSLTEQILDAIVIALDAAGKPAAATINRSRRRAIEPEELPMISVYPIMEEVAKSSESRFAGKVQRRLRVQIKSRVQGEDHHLDPYRQWTLKALMSDPSLDDLTLEIIEESTEWDADDASDADYSVAAMNFIIRFVSSRFDLTA